MLNFRLPGWGEERSWRLSRWLFLRAFGVLYAVAFLVLVRQGPALIGSDGLLPAARYLKEAAGALGPGRFLAVPSLFWLGCSDAVLHGAAWLGLVLSLVVAAGWANAPMLAVLWLLYTSFVHVGQLFYGYGWEMMMVETGFLAVLLAPPWDARPFSAEDAPPVPILWLLRWELFRVMFGAGLIKLRGDACWRNLTCLDYHFETQPIPNPLSWYFHHLPHGLLHGGVLVNHLAELAAPWLAMLTGPVGAAGGLVIAGFQGVLILSGNLSWLNWLTLALCLPCFDDALLRRVLPAALTARFPASQPPPDRSSWLWRARMGAV
ncbi:MAG: lipase maturation factor family protein, partial [Elusimicrobia bacterium]|nr:lipase maturation factor family protein [Elusimicrobiota bacterium]